MSILIQWLIVSVCLIGATAYLLYRLGLFALLGWIKPRAGGACGACAHCPPTARLADRDSPPE